MFKVHLPTTTLFVTPEQLHRLVANILETRYVADSGEFLQTIPHSEPSVGETMHTLLLSSPVDTLKKENEQYQKLWRQARGRAEKAEERLASLKDKCKKRK